MAGSKRAPKDADEKDLEKLAKKLLSTPHKPREDAVQNKRRSVKGARSSPPKDRA